MQWLYGAFAITRLGVFLLTIYTNTVPISLKDQIAVKGVELSMGKSDRSVFQLVHLCLTICTPKVTSDGLEILAKRTQFLLTFSRSKE